MNHPYTFDIRRCCAASRSRLRAGARLVHRPPAAARLGRERPLVRDRAVLRLPRGERLGRRRAVVLDVCPPRRCASTGRRPRTAARAWRAPELWRWRIDPRGNGAVREEQLDDQQRRPAARSTRRYTGRRARFAYASRFRARRRACRSPTALLKYDLESRHVAVHAYGPQPQRRRGRVRAAARRDATRTTAGCSRSCTTRPRRERAARGRRPRPRRAAAGAGAAPAARAHTASTACGFRARARSGREIRHSRVKLRRRRTVA